MSSERRRDRDRDRDDDDGGQRSRHRQRRDDDRHGSGGGGGDGARRSSYDGDRRRQGNAPRPLLSSGLKKDRDADEGLVFETSPGIVAIKSFEKMGLRVRERGGESG